MDEWLIPVKSLAAALGVGILIGIIRERHGPEPFAGLRTHALVALAGVVTQGLGWPVFMVAFAAVGALAVVAYLRNDPQDPGLTGEIALLVNMALAGLAGRQPALAAGLGVVTALLLQGKAQLRHLSRHVITGQEMRDGLLLLAAALVIMPLLPAHAMDPWGALQPRVIWKIVVLVMAAGMLGHVALRLAGAHWGLAVAGYFAGFASSTAATASFGQRARAEPALLAPASAAAILSNLASLMLLLALLATAAMPLLAAMAWPMAAACLVLILSAAWGLRRGAAAPVLQDVGTSRAFKVSHALLIAFMMAAVSLLAAWMHHAAGDPAAMAAAMLAALTELHAAAMSLAQLHAAGRMSQGHAQWGLLGVLGASALAKSVLAFVSGGVRYGSRVTLALAGMVAAAALVQAWGPG